MAAGTFTTSDASIFAVQYAYHMACTLSRQNGTIPICVVQCLIQMTATLALQSHLQQPAHQLIPYCQLNCSQVLLPLLIIFACMQVLTMWSKGTDMVQADTPAFALHLWTRVQPLISVRSVAGLGASKPWETVALACLWLAAKHEEARRALPPASRCANFQLIHQGQDSCSGYLCTSHLLAEAVQRICCWPHVLKAAVAARQMACVEYETSLMKAARSCKICNVGVPQMRIHNTPCMLMGQGLGRESL